MEPRSAFKDYFRSWLNLGLLAAALVAGLAFLGARSPAGFGLALAAYAVATVLAFALRGGKIVAKLRERDDAEKNARRAEYAASLRERIELLRIASPELEKARQLLLLKSGEYLDECARSSLWDPEAERLIEESIAMIQGALKALDSASTEKRFGGEGDAERLPPAAGEGLAEDQSLAGDLARAIKENSGRIGERTAAMSGGPDARDLLAARKELE